jgi:hypothetical protein
MSAPGTMSVTWSLEAVGVSTQRAAVVLHLLAADGVTQLDTTTVLIDVNPPRDLVTMSTFISVPAVCCALMDVRFAR